METLQQLPTLKKKLFPQERNLCAIEIFQLGANKEPLFLRE